MKGQRELESSYVAASRQNVVELPVVDPELLSWIIAHLANAMRLFLGQ